MTSRKLAIVALLLLAFLAGAANPASGDNGSHVNRLDNLPLSAVAQARPAPTPWPSIMARSLAGSVGC